MSKVKVTQVRSMINRPERQKRTLKALGLGKINRSIEVESNPALLGMVRSVSHLLKIEDI
jgi:large subunit ribosomal protein L30